MNKKLGYSKQYYNNRRLSVERSAQIIIPLLMSSFPIKSVVDLGCADGTWLSVFRSFGVGEILGVDGP